MNHITCDIIRDLLPLYADEACSEDSRTLVEEHISHCPECGNLLRDMYAPLDTAPPELDGKAVLSSLKKNLLGIFLIAGAIIACLAINLGGAWMGGPANLASFGVTMLYLIFWGFFSVSVRNYLPMIRVSFVISLLTCIAAVNSLLWQLLDRGGFISAFLSIFASVPFYGFRWLFDWTETYAAASIISLLWLIYTGYHMRKLQKQMKVL